MSGVLRPPSSVAAPDRDDVHIGPKAFFTLVRKALAVSYRARGAASCVVSVVGFALALLPSLISLALGWLADAVQALFEGTVPLTTALTALGALVALHLVQLLYTCVRNYYVEADAERVMRYIRQRVLSLTCRVRMRYIDNSESFAEKVSFVDTVAGLQVAGSMQQVALWLQNLVSFAALAVVLAGVNPWMIVIVVATSAPSILITYRQEREKYRLGKEYARTSAFNQMYYQDATRFQTLQEVKFNRIFSYLKYQKWRPGVDDFVQADTALKKRHVVQNVLADLVSGSVYVFILALAAVQIFENPALGLGVFTLTLSAAGQMQSLASQLFFGITQFVASAPYLQDFFDLDAFECEEDDDGAAAPGEAGGQRPADIVFDNVCFSYPDTSREVLHGISVRIRAGERVAVVGRNGSGKSTFVNLLCGLYAPSAGTVSVGGVDPFTHPRQVRAQLSAVFQDFARYEDTIRANVTIACPQRASALEGAGEGACDAALMQLAEKTGAAGFINARARGLDEVVGSYSEQGNNLSGGQWQRVAITRAAWRADARIMLLDEPTSALDPMAEAQIYRNFADLVEDRTALLISHRLGIASVVDRVLVFEEGRIVEDGTPDELLAAEGVFKELYQAQAKWYQ